MLGALSRIHKYRKVFLFEPNTMWHEPLKLTLSPFADKAMVMPYYLGNVNDPNRMTMDRLSQQIGKEIQYLQADVEGEEMSVLNGAARVLKEAKRMRISICCYHKSSHPAEIRDLERLTK